MDVQIQIVGAERAERRLLAIRDRARDARPAWDQIRPLLAAGERDIFASRGSAIGKVWPALAQSTLRSRKGQGAQPLVATGALLASLAREKGRGQIFRATKTQARFGTSLFYAKFVAKKRPMVGASEKTQTSAARAMVDYLAGT